MTPFKRMRLEVLQVKQGVFADRIGRKQATVSRWESGELVPDWNDLVAILKAYPQVRFIDLFPGFQR